jgi:antitoxin CcdA
MLAADELRRAIRESHQPVARLAKTAGIAPTTLYSFVSGATGSLRASAHAAVEAALEGRRQGVAENRTPFEGAGLDIHPEILEEAARYGIDVAGTARNAVEEAVKAERIRRWNEENREAVDSWNKLVEREGLWSDDLQAF